MLALISRYLSPFGKRRSSCASRKADDKMGEDVKMVSIFNEEDLQQEFEAFAVTIDLTDKPVVDKRKYATSARIIFGQCNWSNVNLILFQSRHSV